MSKGKIACIILVIALIGVVLFGVFRNKSDAKYTEEQYQQGIEKAVAEYKETQIVDKAKIDELQTKLDTANERILEIENNLSNSTNENNGLKLEKLALQQEISELKAELDYYINLVGEQDRTDLAYVTFYFNDEPIKTVIVAKGNKVEQTIDLSEYENQGWVFLGWKNENNESIDLLTQTFNEDTSLYADLTHTITNVDLSQYKFKISVEEVMYKDEVGYILEFYRGEKNVVIQVMKGWVNIGAMIGENVIVAGADCLSYKNYLESEFSFDNFAFNLTDETLESLRQYFITNYTADTSVQIDLVEQNILIPNEYVTLTQVTASYK